MSEEIQAPAETLVEVRDLVKHYGPIRAVDGVSFSVRRGDVLGFLGPNGAGKTTAMKMITGFLEPDRGTVRVAGFDVATGALEARRRIGYLPENAPAYGEMTVTGFLDFVAQAREIGDRPPAVERAIARTGLEGVRHQTIETLSKGFKRRVGLAQALIHEPEVLILDEPTDGLDPNQKVVVHRLIEELAATKAIILSTHVLDEVERVCNRVLIISQGRMLVDSTPEELARRAPRHNVIRFELEVEPPADLLRAVEEQPWCAELRSLDAGAFELHPVAAGNHLAELLELLEGVEVRSVQLQEGRLEELFRQVTGGVAA